MDVDILVEDSAPNLTLLLEVLSRFGEGSARELNPQDFTPDEGCIRVIEDFPLDIFTRMGGHAYRNLLPFSRLHMLGDQSLRYLGPEGLLLLKQSSNRPKDKVDVIELQKLISLKQDTKPQSEPP